MASQPGRLHEKANTLMNDLLHYRDRFAIFEDVAYLNSCSQGALAGSVRGAMDSYMNSMVEFGSDWGHWAGKQEEVRGQLAELLGANVDEVAITPSASAAVNSFASSLFLDGKKSKVVTTSLEFPTIGQIWHAQERRGVTVQHVQADAHHQLHLADFANAIDDDTAVVSVTHICYRNGAMSDIRSIIDLAHDRGVPVLVDAYQSGGAYPVDFHEMGADFLVGGALKYMLGMPGVAFGLVNSATMSDYVPTATGWFAARDIFSMDIAAYEPATDARRFESGTPVIPSLYAVAEGLRILLEVGVDRAWERSGALHDLVRHGVSDTGGTVVTPAGQDAHGPMLAFASHNEEALVAALEHDGVVVSSRDGNIRVSPHFYNDESDVDRLLSSLRTHRHLFA